MNYNNKKPLLTISLLISNRPDTVPRCLNSLLPIMEKIPSELILVDTSKNEEIHELLLTYTDQVYEFEWCKDFAKARNVGLKKAKGEWFMFLDDDEWFVDIEDLVRFFQSGEYKEYGMANYQIRNFFDPRYISYSDGTVGRLFKLEKDSAFHSKIHEYFAPSRGKKKYLSSMVYHTGYMFVTEEKKRAHFERNTSLLLDMIKEEPDVPRWTMQLAQEYCAMHEWETLERFCKKELKKLDREFSKDKVSLFATLCAGYAHALSNQRKYERANAFCYEKTQDSRSLEYLKALMHYVKAENHFYLQEWKEAKAHIEAFIKFNNLLNHEDSPFATQRSILLVGVAFDEGRVAQAYSMLICCDLKEGNVASLYEHYDKLGWEQKNVHVHVDEEQHFVDAMAIMEFDPIFVKIATDGFRNRGLSLYMAHAANRWEEDVDAFKKIMYVFSQAESDDAYVWYSKICMADWRNSPEEVLTYIKGYFDASDNVLRIPNRLRKIAERYQVDLQRHWVETDADKWKASVSHYVAYATEEERSDLRYHINRVFSRDDWKYHFCNIRLLSGDDDRIEEWVEKTFAFYDQYYKNEIETVPNKFELYENMQRSTAELLIEDVENSNEDVVRKCHKFMVSTLEFYLCIFKDMAFEGEMEMIPPEVRAAVWLNDLFGKEETDWEGRLSALRECAKAYPALGHCVKKFAKYIGEQREHYETRVAQSANSELSEMIDLMKEKILQLAEQGMKKEAMVILKQVRALAPNDLELMQLEKELE